ncbi:MAG: carbohydrate kinase, partial [Actinobacteria bacterium]|nr:carbohydrate kinase [Actinomycetota bacterium]
RALAARAHAGGGRVALDLGQASGDLWRLDELDDLREALDLLIGNAHEVELLLGAPYELARDGLRSAYEGPVVVKRGRDGATLDLDAHTPPADVPAARVNAVNPVGAGDAFDAGLLAAWCSGRTLLDAVRFACAVGAASVASPEGPQGVTRRAVDELLQE